MDAESIYNIIIYNNNNSWKSGGQKIFSRGKVEIVDFDWIHDK